MGGRTVAAPSFADSAVVELRQYTLRPGRRDELVALFEAELVAPQEACGMTIGGLFRDLDDPDRFVWQRGFADMAGRHRALESFYGGQVWREHGPAANATMLDSDDVLLLRATDPPHPPPASEPGPGSGVVSVGVIRAGDDPARESLLATRGHEVLEEGLGAAVALWRTEPTPNTYPALPVRAERVVVWQATFPGESARHAALERLDASSTWRRLVGGPGSAYGERRLRLRPTGRSRHPHAGSVRR
ncbi:MAG TPA: NIPSNAP family protein [Nocardioides sp.]|uniref:NIPSNAP family protein n=1 Tax=Nocardioides sp. TaxID=35761 RepID=UPI002F42BEBC